MIPRSKLSRRNLALLRRPASKAPLPSCRSFTQWASHLPPLPPMSDWKHIFEPPRGGEFGMIRPWLTNIEAQSKCLEKFGLDKDDGIPKTVIEIYPGPGGLSRAILSLPRDRVKKLIIMEDWTTYHPYLEELAAADDRVTLIKQSGYFWEPFEDIKRNGTLAHIKQVFDGSVHPELRLVAQLPVSMTTEQLVSQWIRTMPVKAWLWHYGRVPLHMFVDKWVHTRLTAPLGHRHRGKLSVLSQTLCNVSQLQPPELVSPYETNWYPPPSKSETTDTTFRSRRAGHPMIACTMIPNDFNTSPVQGQQIDEWDFVLRNAFVLASSPIKKALSITAPGAAALLDKEGTKYINPKTTVRNLTAEDWAAIMTAFNQWPFKPKTLVLPDSSAPRVGRGFMKDDD